MNSKAIITFIVYPFEPLNAVLSDNKGNRGGIDALRGKGYLPYNSTSEILGVELLPSASLLRKENSAFASYY